MSKLFVENYYDGFKVEQIDCWNLALACASGYYLTENYFYYCFLYALKRWCFEEDAYLYNNTILKEMGIVTREKK